MMIKASPLPDGGTIGVPAPAWSYHNRSEVLRGVEWWESRGYRVKLAEGIYDRHGYLAGDAQQRAKDIAAMFTDPEVDAIQCLMGGFGSAQAIPYIDFEAIAQNPKPFVGYSDITALHTAIRHHTNLVTFYGPGLAGVGDKDTAAFTRDRLLLALTTTEPLGEIPRAPDDSFVRALSPGLVSAPLVGGCLSLLAQTMGTPWQFNATGKLLFIEDTETAPWEIEAMLTQLGQAGVLDDVTGVVVGELAEVDWSKAEAGWPQLRSVEDILEEHIGSLGVPAMYGLPLGHGKYLSTLPLGVAATLDADKRTLTIDEPALDQ